MSKLLEQLKSEFTGIRRARMSRFVKIEKDIIERDFQYEYKINAIFGTKGFCQKEDIGLVFDNIYKQIKRELYEEIQDRFRELELAIYEEDREQIDVLLREINREIY